MTHPLLEKSTINQTPDAYLNQNGRIFAYFGENTQDSGNISYGVQVGDERYFVKTAGFPNDSKPALSHSERVKLLQTAVSLAQTVQHPTLIPLHNVIHSPHGPLLVYDWVSGELVRNVIPRFTALPVADILTVLDQIYALHVILAAQGWIAQDFYDGCLLYDFAAKQLRVMDLDHYQREAFVNERGRLFGSSRYMAPEEFEKGAMIDQRSNVFTMGRTAVNLLSDGTLNPASFRATPAHFAVVQRACAPNPADRYPTLAAFTTAWQAASPTVRAG